MKNRIRRRSCSLLALSLTLAGMAGIMSAERSVLPLNRGWEFAYGDRPQADTSDMTIVNLPHDFQISQPWVEPGPDERPDDSNPIANIRSRLSSRAFKEMGKGYYRKELIPDAEWKDKRVLIDFEGIMLTGDVYLNGDRIGGTDYGYLGFESDISTKLKYGEPNLIEVIADTGAPDNSRWYTGGGLYRDVNIIVTDPDYYFVRHPLHITTPEVGEGRSTVIIDGEIAVEEPVDSIAVGVRIKDGDGKTVYDNVGKLWNNKKQKRREFRIDSLSIAESRLWDLDTPHLYTAELTLYRPDGSVADEVSERFGLRTIEYSPEFGFKLNGRKALLQGIANHHTLGALGAAAYPRAMEKRIKLLKEFGFNHIRTSHNPYSESFLDLCDENGILVVDELYDKWTPQYCGGRGSWEDQWQGAVTEWARRDRNHPSVIMWSFGNELQLIPDLPYNDWGVTPYRLQKTLMQKYDTERPATVAMHPRGRDEHTDSLPAPLALATDIAAYNYRYMYFPGDSRRFPWMIFYQSEANTSNMGPNWFEMDLDKVTGAAYWGMIDYLGESHGWPAKGWKDGVFDISLEPKPSAYFIRSYFKPDEPLVRIGVNDGESSVFWNDVVIGGKTQSSHWNRREGSIVSLYTYTNADEVELILNGKSLGRRPNNRENTKERNRILWDSVAYKPGYLEALAYNEGDKKPIARHRIETSGDAVKLIVTGDNPQWRADGTDLVHLKIEAADSKGRRDYGCRLPLRFKVDGEAEIVGVINGDIYSEELSVGDSRRLYNGSATVILRSTPTAGEVKLTVTPENTTDKKLKPVTLKTKTL